MAGPRPVLTSLPKGLDARHPAAWLATWFFTGLLPRAPGTWGSLAALPFAWAIVHWSTGHGGGRWPLIVAVLLVFALGCWASAVYLRHSDSEDPGAVVVDEVAGMWLTLAAIPPDALENWPLLYALGFLYFRAADILKPWPIRWLDRNLKGGLGVMVDDIAAGLLAAALLWLSVELLPFI